MKSNPSELRLGLVKNRVVLKAYSAKGICKKYQIDSGMGHVADIILMGEINYLPKLEIMKLIGKYLKNPFLKPQEVLDDIQQLKVSPSVPV